MDISSIRSNYHEVICAKVLRVQNNIPNIADKSSVASKTIALSIIEQLECQKIVSGKITGQRAGSEFEHVTRNFLEDTFSRLHHLRPGNWTFSLPSNISQFEQYRHLAELKTALDTNPQLKSAIGMDYLITPDIVVARYPVPDGEINADSSILSEKHNLCQYTPLRQTNSSVPLLHASVSCKWTIRSDRAQNIRAEALNLIRNRKGHTPRIVAVTAEPLPTRLASLALGTGDLDCVYHFALPELQHAVVDANNEDQQDMLDTLIGGNRLRDISDLPFDLAI